MVAGPEPAHVARVADNDCGHHGADAVDIGHRGLGGRHRHLDALSRGGDGSVETAKIGHELAGLGLALGGHALCRPDPPEQRPGPLGRQTPGKPAWNERGEARMEPTRSLGAQRPQVVVAGGQHPQDGSVVVGSDLAQTSLAQRGDGRRESVVGIVLLRASRAQHAHSRCQGRRHVEHLLAGGDQLLGQQIAETGR